MNIFKKLKQKRCENCIHKYKAGNVFACYRINKKVNLRMLYPLRLICFRYERGD